MARRHGWQLPSQGFQIGAITLYFLLCIAFYAFLAPFLGKDLYEYIAIGVYSFFALSVLFLYIRCTAIDPADPGILIDVNEGATCRSQTKSISQGEHNTHLGLKTGKYERKSSACWGLSGFFCACFVIDDCRRDEDTDQQQANSNDMLFCTLCNAEVSKFSKHCRNCDKCIYGFDHHCRWLNNCVGRKNYVTFLLLITTTILWLIIEVGVGVVVLVHCFTHKQATEVQIVERLGIIFSRTAFASVVAVSTALGFLAIIPVGELLCFHILLIRKGITTYQYVLAMRTQSEPPGPSVREDQLSLASSPFGSSITGLSGASLGLQYRGALCTPPRIFTDYQDEVIPHLERGRVPSTIDPDRVEAFDRAKRLPKQPIRISAWNLAKLDSNEAIKAAARARASSSILRPINSHLHLASYNSTINSEFGPLRCTRTATTRPFPLDSSYAPSLSSREDIETCPQTPSDYSSQYAGNASVLEQQHPSVRLFNPVYQMSANHSPISIQTNDDYGSITASERLKDTKIHNSSIYWDRNAGRFLFSQPNISSSSQAGATELTYSGQSIFFGGPLWSDRNAQRSQSVLDRRRDPYQLPVFAPAESQENRSYRM